MHRVEIVKFYFRIFSYQILLSYSKKSDLVGNLVCCGSVAFRFGTLFFTLRLLIFGDLQVNVDIKTITSTLDGLIASFFFGVNFCRVFISTCLIKIIYLWWLLLPCFNNLNFIFYACLFYSGSHLLWVIFCCSLVSLLFCVCKFRLLREMSVVFFFGISIVILVSFACSVGFLICKLFILTIHF